MQQPAENLQVIRHVAAAFSSLQIPYAIGGSVASSVLGIPRFTQDADFTTEPVLGRESELAALLGSDYYISLPAVVEANRLRSSFKWSDILGVLKVQAGRLDEAYLDHWAADLRVSDLLARARTEAGGGAAM